MYRLEASYRCELFEKIAEMVWDDIAAHHHQGIHRYETAVTNEIITIIREHHQVKNIALWANNAVDEKVHGSDLDIFAESGTNEFYWYALQAKVLTPGGRYTGISDKAQYTKLAKLEQLSGCIPYYVFYNGRSHPLPGVITSCKHQVSEKQMGCALVANHKMEGLIKSYPNLKYHDLHPTHASPWRELVCCTTLRSGGTLYDLGQIKDAVSLYEGVVNADIVARGDNDAITASRGRRSAIGEANEAAGRQPKLTMVIRTTQGLNQPSS